MLSQALHSSGADVQAAQQALASMGYTGADGRPLVTDGSFGPNTTYAVRAFQSAEGLTVDGVIGPQTQAALDQATAPPAFEIGVTDVTSGTVPASTSTPLAGAAASIIPGVPNAALYAAGGFVALLVVAVVVKRKK